MIQRIARRPRISRMLACATFVICFRTSLMAQNQGADTRDSGAALSVTHILGFEGISRNAAGELSIEGDALRFQTKQGSRVQIAISSIHDLTIGEQDKQVGGVPMTLARSATPYGGGRVVALFSHKTFDTVTLEYLDPNGGYHGAVFQLSKGQGQVLEGELRAKGVHIGVPATSKESTQETKNEVK